MTHRAEQIVDAVVAALRGHAALGVNRENVRPFATFSLSEEQGELPAISVDVGDDQPAPDFDHLTQIASQLELTITARLRGTDEEDVKRSAFAVRTEVHKALVADVTFGLSFVHQITYAGAAAPELDSSSEMIVCSYEQRWLVVYWMEEDDPS